MGTHHSNSDAASDFTAITGDTVRETILETTLEQTVETTRPLAQSPIAAAMARRRRRRFSVISWSAWLLVGWLAADACRAVAETPSSSVLTEEMISLLDDLSLGTWQFEVFAVDQFAVGEGETSYYFFEEDLWIDETLIEEQSWNASDSVGSFPRSSESMDAVSLTFFLGSDSGSEPGSIDSLKIRFEALDGEPLEAGVFASADSSFRINHIEWGLAGQILALDVDFDVYNLDQGPVSGRVVWQMELDPDEQPYVGLNEKELESAYPGIASVSIQQVALVQFTATLIVPDSSDRTAPDSPNPEGDDLSVDAIKYSDTPALTPEVARRKVEREVVQLRRTKPRTGALPKPALAMDLGAERPAPADSGFAGFGAALSVISSKPQATLSDTPPIRTVRREFAVAEPDRTPFETFEAPEPGNAYPIARNPFPAKRSTNDPARGATPQSVVDPASAAVSYFDPVDSATAPDVATPGDLVGLLEDWIATRVLIVGDWLARFNAFWLEVSS